MVVYLTLSNTRATGCKNQQLRYMIQFFTCRLCFVFFICYIHAWYVCHSKSMFVVHLLLLVSYIAPESEVSKNIMAKCLFSHHYNVNLLDHTLPCAYNEHHDKCHKSEQCQWYEVNVFFCFTDNIF
jgi:hypothetical protein